MKYHDDNMPGNSPSNRKQQSDAHNVQDDDEAEDESCSDNDQVSEEEDSNINHSIQEVDPMSMTLPRDLLNIIEDDSNDLIVPKKEVLKMEGRV